MASNFIFLFFGVIILWLGVITVFIWNTITHYNKLSKGLTDKSFKSVIENLIKETEGNKKDIDYLRSYCDKIHKDGLLHIQKIGLIRFNPFKDTGGNQSFILSLVDGNNTGVVISGLYARSGTRWYAKKVVKGESQEHELSDEEKMAIAEAKTYKL